MPQIRCEIPEDVHRALRMEAASYGMNATDLYADVLTEHARDEGDD